MALAGREVSVVGAGIGGLAVARALALRGAKVAVFEKTPELGEVGAGIQISPNGMKVIEALGLTDALREVSVAAQSVILRNGLSGSQVVRLDLNRPDNPGPYYFVHRARLLDCLIEGARSAGVEIQTGREIGNDLPGDLIVGGDGIRSHQRQVLNGPYDPVFTGQVAWRALIPEPEGSKPVVEVFMGPGRHLVSYPLRNGLRNIVAVEEREEWAEEGWNIRDNPEVLRNAFHGFSDRVRQWLDQVEQVHLWGLFRHDKSASWQDGLRVLIGDAAHPTLPFLAQGANMALEDAWCLAALLDRYPQSQALTRYEELRKPRTQKIVAAATANARNYHLSNPVFRRMAHTLLRVGGAVAPGRISGSYDWIYRFDAIKNYGDLNN